MGNFLDRPITEKQTSQGEGNGLNYAVSSMQGWRTEMEDAHITRIGLGGGYEDWSFFGIFDGHGGHTVSNYSAENLLKCIMDTPEFAEGSIKEAIIAGFLNMDASLYRKPEFSSGEDRSGSTAICALMNSTHIYVINLGDSRCMLCNNGMVCFTTIDHKPNTPREKERILSAGGNVVLQRLNGTLAVSRALGDFQYKTDHSRHPGRQLVSVEPDVYISQRENGNEFLILACDGIWDVMTNEDVSDYVRYLLSITPNLVSVTNQLIDTCFHKKSFDNMSVILISFNQNRTLSPLLISRDEILNRKLENLVRSIVGTQTDTDFRYILNILEDEDIPDLPPGGGLSSKMTLIYKVYQELCPQAAERWITQGGYPTV